MQILCYPKYSVLNNSLIWHIAEDPGSLVSECGTYNQTFSSLTVECEAREAGPATQPSTTFIFHIQNAHSQVTFMSIIYRV